MDASGKDVRFEGQDTKFEQYSTPICQEPHATLMALQGGTLIKVYEQDEKSPHCGKIMFAFRTHELDSFIEQLQAIQKEIKCSTP